MAVFIAMQCMPVEIGLAQRRAMCIHLEAVPVDMRTACRSTRCPPSRSFLL